MIIKTKKILLSSALFASISIANIAYAQNITIAGKDPRIFYDDTFTAGDGNEWQAVGADEWYGIYDDVRNHYVIRVFPGLYNNESIEIGSGGDINLADGSVFIDRSANRVGIGTTTPAHELDIVSYSPVIRLEDTDGVAWELNRNDLSSIFDIANDTVGVSMFKIFHTAPENSLVLTDNGVGIGTQSPQTALHVKKDGDQMLLLENTATTNATRRLMKMTNKGPVGFEMEDTDLGDIWQFRTDNAGKFVANKLGNTGSEFSVDSAGNGRFLGEVRAAGVLLDSSRASKTDINPIKPEEVMAKLKQVEIAEWRYKKADKNDRHISPMAEDFYSLFKLGRDGKSINPNDLASVAIVAAKELQKKTDTVSDETTLLRIETKVLKEENSLLKERLTSLEKLLTNLALGKDLLTISSNKVVIHQ